MNLRPHHHRELSKRFFSGASRDLGKERNIKDKEFYFDALNMRPSSKAENFGDMEKIGGYVSDFRFALSSSYVNLVSFFVGAKLVNIWVDGDGNLEPVITVDNYIVCRSSELPFEVGSHIQYDVDAFEGGGFFTITNYETPPLIFDIGDMLDNLTEAKYFVDFRRVNYEINLSVPLDHPIFVDLVELSGTSGVHLGQHEYYIRYVTDAGDKTLLSHPTPLIPVPNQYYKFDADYLPNYIFPYYKTRGADANILRSKYGIKIKFRVNNLFNFDYVEILRASYSNGEAIGYTPNIEIIKKIALSPGEISIKEFIDSESTQDTPIALVDIESQTYLSTIKKAFTLRFYNRRLVLNNLEYGLFDMDEVEFKQFELSHDKLETITELLTVPGAHKDIDISTFSKTVGFKSAYNHAYKRSYMNSERYGFGILGLGTIAQKSFIKPIETSSYEMPQRRKLMPLNSVNNSIEPVTAATTSNDINKTFEVFDLTESRQRDTTYDNGYVNIIDSGGTSNYSPRHPISVTDTNNQHYIRNTIAVKYAAANLTQDYYNPYGYGERFHTLGMLFAGLEDYPDEMKAFSVVRTKKAGRVICQGIAMYHFTHVTPDPPQKSRDEVIFYSPDIVNGVVDPAVISNIANNPSNYKVIIESPVGYFMDVYNALVDGATACKTDMILAANVYVEQNARRINLGEAATVIGVNDGTDGYTAYGKYRNAIHGAGDSIYGDGENGTYQLTIEEFQEITNTESEGVAKFRIKFTENLYKDTGAGGSEFDQNENFCEPFYIISIIDDSKDISDSNVIEYQKTEHYQKIEALIGISNGEANQTFETVDERPDDFFIEVGDTSTNKFIYIDDGSGDKKIYINITEKSPADIALIDDDIADETDLFCGEFLTGKFKATYVDGIFYVNFDSDCTTPEDGDSIYILYDNRFPIKFFGGDAFTHNCYAPVIHRSTKNDITAHTESELFLGVGMPYYTYDLNPDINIIIDTDPVDVQSGVDNQDIPLDYIRQLLVSFPCTSYSHLAMAYNPHFPLVNYVPRPSSWTSSQEPSEQNIFIDYETDFPDEKSRWNLGGFRIPQTFINLDYSKESITNKYYSAPAVGFSDEVIFYNRYAWSLSKPVNTAKLPSWKSFMFTNVFDGTDKFGQGKRLFDQRLTKQQGGGLNNLICFTEETAFEVATERVYISSADGNTLQTTGASGVIPFISEENNLGVPGMPTWLWRFSAELEGSLYYCDRYGFYRMSDKFQDINNLYSSKLFPLLQSLPDEYSADVFISKYLDTKNKEYGFNVRYSGYSDITVITEALHVPYGSIQGCISAVERSTAQIIFHDVPTSGVFSYCLSNVGDEDIDVFFDFDGFDHQEVVLEFTITAGFSVIYTIQDGVFISAVATEGISACSKCILSEIDSFHVFSQREEIFNWLGSYNYDFDYFCSADGKVYGFKDGERFLLDDHSEDASTMESELLVMYSPEDWHFVEFVRFNVSANKKPDFVYFLDSTESVTGTVLAANIRNYSGYEQYVPLNSVTRSRHQGKNQLMKISHSATTDLVVIRSATIQYKKIN